ncbi:hypothetical protein HDU96_011102 [Phlyctochytrium bullatum]|nr:hypothetical protein HDU96_011102 [Phlyctochytrium bullatum]
MHRPHFDSAESAEDHLPQPKRLRSISHDDLKLDRSVVSIGDLLTATPTSCLHDGILRQGLPQPVGLHRSIQTPDAFHRELALLHRASSPDSAAAVIALIGWFEDDAEDTSDDDDRTTPTPTPPLVGNTGSGRPRAYTLVIPRYPCNLAGWASRIADPHTPLPADALDHARELIAHRLAAAVARLHAVGVLHNNLHPRLVFLDHADRPLVADFGLACLKGAKPPRGAPQPAFPDPDGEGPDELSDAWALGATLFEFWTRRPFAGPEGLEAVENPRVREVLGRLLAPRSERATPEQVVGLFRPVEMTMSPVDMGERSLSMSL